MRIAVVRGGRVTLDMVSGTPASVAAQLRALDRSGLRWWRV